MRVQVGWLVGVISAEKHPESQPLAARSFGPSERAALFRVPRGLIGLASQAASAAGVPAAAIPKSALLPERESAEESCITFRGRRVASGGGGHWQLAASVPAKELRHFEAQRGCMGLGSQMACAAGVPQAAGSRVAPIRKRALGACPRRRARFRRHFALRTPSKKMISWSGSGRSEVCLDARPRSLGALA